MKRSKFGKISGVDLLNALYHGVAAVSVPLVGIIGAGHFPTQSEWMFLLSVALGAIFGDIFKRTATNSDGQPLRKEK